MEKLEKTSEPETTVNAETTAQPGSTG